MNNLKNITTISPDNDVITLINVFTVDASNQEKLVQLLQDDTLEVMQYFHGWVSASIHASLDGKTVVNYAQWKTIEDWQAMTKDTGAKDRIENMRKLAVSNPHLYLVKFTHHA
jgi:hypothetical protein